MIAVKSELSIIVQMTIFMTGWDKDGMEAHTKLLGFFVRMRRHEIFDDLIDACRVWWAENKNGKGRKKVQNEHTIEKDKEWNFLEFTEMMRV